MATRAFAKMTTDFHDEPSIRNLTIDQQWAYELVMKRPDLSRCGVVAYTPKRWSKFAHDATEKKLRRLYDHLEKTRHVVIDDDTEELFARTYVRHDGLLSQPNVVAAMVSDYQLINSDTIRLAFLTELRRIWDLDLEHGTRGGWKLAMGIYPPACEDGARRFPDGMTSKALAPLQRNIGVGLSVELAQAIDQELVRPFDKASEKGYPEGFPEGPTCARPYGPSPTTAPTTAPPPAPTVGREPFPVTDPAATDPPTPALQQPTRTLALLDEHDPWVPRVRAQLAPVVDELLTAGIPDDAIRTGIATWRSSRKGPRYLANLVQDQLAPTGPNGHQSRAAKALALASRLDAQGGTP